MRPCITKFIMKTDQATKVKLLPSERKILESFIYASSYMLICAYGQHICQTE